MRFVVSLVLILIGAGRFDRPAAAQQRVSQEPPRVTPVPSGRIRATYEPGQPIPPGYHVVARPRTGFIIAGAVVFGVTYAINGVIGLVAIVIDANTGAHDKEQYFIVPVAGPIIVMALKGEVVGPLVADAVIQAAGIGLIAFGASTSSQKLVRDRVAIRGVGPMAVAGGSGFTLSGTF